jgi:hypothetical protein
MIILIMSPPTSPTSSRSRPSNSRDEPALTTRGHGRDELATRIEQQRAKIRALEPAAKECRRSDELRNPRTALKSRVLGWLHQQRLAGTISTKDIRALSPNKMSCVATIRRPKRRLVCWLSWVIKRLLHKMQRIGFSRDSTF